MNMNPGAEIITSQSHHRGPVIPNNNIAQPQTQTPSCGGGGGRGGGGGGRSRKRNRNTNYTNTKTTLLNATPNNFRALVHQFTGCHTSPRGPINLNFAQYSTSDNYFYNSHPPPLQHHQYPAPLHHSLDDAPITFSDITTTTADTTTDHDQMFSPFSSSSSLKYDDFSSTFASTSSFQDIDNSSSIDLELELDEFPPQHPEAGLYFSPSHQHLWPGNFN